MFTNCEYVNFVFTCFHSVVLSTAHLCTFVQAGYWLECQIGWISGNGHSLLFFRNIYLNLLSLLKLMEFQNKNACPLIVWNASKSDSWVSQMFACDFFQFLTFTVIGPKIGGTGWIWLTIKTSISMNDIDKFGITMTQMV